MIDALRFNEGPMMIRWMRHVSILVMLALSPVDGDGQVVRGSVLEETSGSPVVGAVITLVRANGSSAASVLSNERGEYAVRAPGPGRYGIQAKRIGVRRIASALFDLSMGETRRADLVIESVLYRQPEILITGYTSCDVRASESARVAALWDEARTALTASGISQRDQLFKASVVRYARELDSTSRKVLSETRSQASGIIERPFVSVPAAELSREGYVRAQDDGTHLFYGPDAEVLVSDEFLADHCFRVVDGGRRQRGLVGLGFEPTTLSDKPDVRGTLWLDEKSSELRFIEYAYTRLPDGTIDSRVGGQVHFARLASGAWIVSRWFIRMPRHGRRASPPMTLGGATPNVLVRPVMIGLLEEGGHVQVAGITVAATGAVAGVARDSAGRRPLGGATVLLSGTRFLATADSLGRFRFDSVPVSGYTLVVRHPTYDLLDVIAGQRQVEVKSGDTVRADVTGRGTDALVGLLCPGLVQRTGAATLHVQVIDAVTGAPTPKRRVVLTWARIRGLAGAVESGPHSLDAMTNDRGAISFCQLPAETAIQLSIFLADGSKDQQTTVVLPAGAITARQIRVDTPG